jgi:TRAP-type transport system large permease protein
MAELVRYVWPFVALQYGVLLLCLAFPGLVIGLPRALGY